MSKRKDILKAKRDLPDLLRRKKVRHKVIGGSLWFAFGIMVIIGLVTILPNLNDPDMPVTASVFGGVAFLLFIAAMYTTTQKA